MAKNNIDDLPIKLLSVAYRESKKGTFAWCPSCNELFQDDIPNYGSLVCPNCEHALVRGVTENELVDGKFKGFPVGFGDSEQLSSQPEPDDPRRKSDDADPRKTRPL